MTEDEKIRQLFDEEFGKLELKMDESFARLNKKLDSMIHMNLSADDINKVVRYDHKGVN